VRDQTKDSERKQDNFTDCLRDMTKRESFKTGFASIFEGKG